jgi:hypothetical protein
MKTISFLAIAAILLTSAAVQAGGEWGGYETWTRTAADVETKTGGTFLNFHIAAETRNGITISAVALGSGNPWSENPSYDNWSVDDSSDSSRFVGNCVEDNNRRTGLSTVDGRTPLTPVSGGDWSAFSVVISGLTANAKYNLKVVAMGCYEASSNPIEDKLDIWQPDIGIDNHDFSYGASAGSMTTIDDASLGTEIYSEVATFVNTRDTDPQKPVGYKYWKGSFANNIGQWTANGAGEITLFVGQGNINTVLNGARTMLDGVVVVRDLAAMAHDPIPADDAEVKTTQSSLSWTNPDPNGPGGVLTCDVYLGTEPNRLSMDKKTLGAGITSVAINTTNFPIYGTLVDQQTYYWIVDVNDTSEHNIIEGLQWRFNVNNNDAPVVSAGLDQVAWLGKSGTAGQEVINLDGTTSDDGLPNPPAAYTVKWTQVSGPAVTISPDNINDTSVTITIAGVYVFQLTANDTKKQASDTVQVIVGNNSCHASYLNGTNYNSKDFNTDCNVDLADLEEFVDAWLACTNTQEGCL